jgi:hypothetical protein
MARSSARYLNDIRFDPDYAKREFGLDISVPLYGYQVPVSSNPTSLPPTSDHIPTPEPYQSWAEKRDAAKRGEIARYTVTGSEIYAAPTRAITTIPAILSGVPKSLDITEIAKIRANHVIFFNRGSGTVEAVLLNTNKTALSFYRRYYSNVAMVDEINKEELISYSSSPRYMLTNKDGESVKWLPKAEMKAWLMRPSAERNALTDDCKLEPKEMTFAGLKFDRPANLNWSRVRYIIATTIARKDA